MDEELIEYIQEVLYTHTDEANHREVTNGYKYVSVKAYSLTEVENLEMLNRFNYVKNGIEMIPIHHNETLIVDVSNGFIENFFVRFTVRCE